MKRVFGWLGCALCLGGCIENSFFKDTDLPPTPVDTSDPEPVDTAEVTDTCPEADLSRGTVSVDEDCVALEAGGWTPMIEWTDSTLGNVYTTPVVGNLTDDNGDGFVDDLDTPDIVVVNNSSQLFVVSGDGSGIHWSTTSSVQSTTPVIGDINDDGWPDVVAVAGTGYTAFQGSNGAILWEATHTTARSQAYCGSLGLYDLDADGLPEIVVGSTILDGATGAVRGTGSFGYGTAIESPVAVQSVAADIDLDGYQEVIVGNAAYDADGNTLWSNAEADGYVAVGNFDADPEAEIVVASSGGAVRLMEHDGTVIWRSSLPTGRIGPPTIADLDGDGEPEIGVAGSAIYAALDTDGTLMWQRATQDGSSGCTGSSVFDFEGDGEAEIVYADEDDVWVFDGSTGSVKLQETYHSNLTCTEYPTVADVDNDGHAEIVYGSYQFSDSVTGITVIGDADDSWMPTRTLWNQHAYNITNIRDDLSVPESPIPNWSSYNTFRSADLASATGGALSDAIPQWVETCEVECDDGYLRLVVRVGNGGTEALPAGLPVSLYRWTGTEWEWMETRTTVDSIPSGETTAGIQFDLAPADVPEGQLMFVVDDDDGTQILTECHEDNNVLEISEGLCH